MPAHLALHPVKPTRRSQIDVAAVDRDDGVTSKELFYLFAKALRVDKPL
jgi:hypothetical protein